MRREFSTNYLTACLCAMAIIVGAACSSLQTKSTHTGMATAPSEKPFLPLEESLAEHTAAPDWFRDAKLGIYFHWGPYTVPAKVNEWYPRWMHFDVPEDVWGGGKRGYHIDLKKWHTENYGDPSEFGYHDFIPMFTGEHFDADEWADLFQQSGARFAGLVAEHHDGYAMWDSEITPWNAAETGPHTDITGELLTALRARKIKTLTTFHHARNLQRHRGQSLKQGVRVNELSGNLVTHYDSHYPWIEGLPPASDDPELSLLYGNIPEDIWLEDVWLGKLVEVIDKYQPDAIWFDVWLKDIPDDKKYEFAAYYLNAGSSSGQDVALFHKYTGLPTSFSIPDYEKGRRDKLTEDPWLTDDTLSTGSWSYTDDLEIKPAHWVLHDFIDIVSKNGQLLLNISPRADGIIPDNQRAVLAALGEWLSINGEAIYETRPWTMFGEGPTEQSKGGHFLSHIDYTPDDIRFTTRGDALYAISLGMPKSELVISSLASGSAQYANEVTHVEALNGDHIAAWSRRSDGLHIALKDDAPTQMAYAFKIVGR